MKKCKDIENSLPLYSEGILSEAEKQAVEEHLPTCAECRKEVAYLQKTGQLVEHLTQVEEPPWFQQKIMAKVREEAAKKRLAHKWFYPLRIKIPVQIMATIVIAVLAVYIYRSGNEQVKEILPGANVPVIETKKEQAPAQMPQVKDMAESAVSRKKAVIREEVKQDKQVMSNMAAGGSMQSSRAPESKPKAAREADADKAKGLAENKEKVAPMLQPELNELESAKAQVKDQAKRAEDRSLPALAKKREAYQTPAQEALRSMAASIAVQPQASFLVRVDDMNAAAAEVENVLAKYDAKKVTKQLVENKVVIQAEVSGKYLKDVLSKLKGIGQVEEKVMTADVGERGIAVAIDIISR